MKNIHEASIPVYKNYRSELWSKLHESAWAVLLPPLLQLVDVLLQWKIFYSEDDKNKLYVLSTSILYVTHRPLIQQLLDTFRS